MKKRRSILESELIDKPLFCTECGEKLEDFCFSEEAKNLEIVKKHHEKCKKVKRFKGEKCSRIFIAEPTEPIDPDEL